MSKRKILMIIGVLSFLALVITIGISMSKKVVYFDCPQND